MSRLAIVGVFIFTHSVGAWAQLTVDGKLEFEAASVKPIDENTGPFAMIRHRRQGPSSSESSKSHPGPAKVQGPGNEDYINEFTSLLRNTGVSEHVLEYPDSGLILLIPLR